MSDNVYEQIARYYDLTHDQLTQDIPYILQLARQSEGPVLELGCGSGRLLIPLARAGHRVVGVDNSPAMLARARIRLQKLSSAQRMQVQLLSADMTNLNLTAEIGQSYQLALLPYNTAMHLTPTQLTQTLKQVRTYLGENGRFFIDLANPFIVSQTPNDRLLTLENVLIDPETNDTIVQMASNWLDEDAQTLHITWLYDATPNGKGSVLRTIVQVAYHYLYPHQLELALRDAGFRVASFCGDYDGTPFDETSMRLLILADRISV